MTSQSCLTYADFKVSVLIDGKEIPHYGIETNEEKREVSCWIASEAGKVTNSLPSSIDLTLESGTAYPAK